jgi:glutaredoxin
MIEIYGKDACPYTQAARDAYEPKGAVYLNVTKDPQAMARMVELSKGRRVPVIVEDGNVTVGYGGT